jgi:peptide/nickel transport system permease protein
VRRSFLILAAYALAALAAAAGLLVTEPDLARAWEAASPRHWLGTDQIGRDLLKQCLAGARVALIVGLLAGGTATLLGGALGMIAGWRGGAIDRAIFALSALVSAVPGLLLVLVLGFLIGGGATGVFLAVGLVSWVGICRLVRAETIRLKSTPFVEAARAGGARGGMIALRHLLPNLAHLLGVQFALAFVFAVKAEIVLTFLGVGLGDAASWGRMLADAWGFADLTEGRWLRVVAVSAATAGLVLAVQGIADRLRDRAAPGAGLNSPIC